MHKYTRYFYQKHECYDKKAKETTMLANDKFLDDLYDKVGEKALQEQQGNPLTQELYDKIIEDFEEIDREVLGEYTIHKVSIGENGGVLFNIRPVGESNIIFLLEYLGGNIIYWQKINTLTDVYREGLSENPIWEVF